MWHIIGNYLEVIILAGLVAWVLFCTWQGYLMEQEP